MLRKLLVNQKLIEDQEVVLVVVVAVEEDHEAISKIRVAIVAGEVKETGVVSKVVLEDMEVLEHGNSLGLRIKVVASGAHKKVVVVEVIIRVDLDHGGQDQITLATTINKDMVVVQ